MEVVCTAPRQDIATVVKLALEEDVDVIAISSLATRPPPATRPRPLAEDGRAAT